MNVAALLTKLLKRHTLYLGLAPASWQPARVAGSSTAGAIPGCVPPSCQASFPLHLPCDRGVLQLSAGAWQAAYSLPDSSLIVFSPVQEPPTKWFGSGVSPSVVLHLPHIVLVNLHGKKSPTRNVHLPFLDWHAIKMGTLWSLQCPGCYSGMSCKTVLAPKPYGH